MGLNPRPRRDRRLKLVPKTARPPRHHDQPFARLRENRKGHTKHSGPTNQYAQHQQAQKPQAQHNHPIPTRRSGTPPLVGQPQPQSWRAGQQRQGGGTNAGTKTTRQHSACIHAATLQTSGKIRKKSPRDSPYRHAGPHTPTSEGESVRGSKSARACVRMRAARDLENETKEA